MAALGLEDPLLQQIKRAPAFWAKLGHHPYWPARLASREEAKKYLQYQKKSTQICVKFYGSNDIGWILPSSCVHFSEGMQKNFHGNTKVIKNFKFVAGFEEAARIYEDQHGANDDLEPGDDHSQSPCHIGGGNDSYLHINGGSTNNGSQACLNCNSLRYGDPDWLTCKSCGSGYHTRCVSAFGRNTAAEGSGDRGKKEKRCRLCPDGGSLIAKPPSSDCLGSFRTPWGLSTRALSSEDSSIGIGSNAEGRKGKARLRGDSGSEANKRRKTTGAGQEGERKTGPDADWDGWGTSDAWDEQEIECFICKEPGMLIQCDAPHCRSAYHKACLGLSAWGQRFHCPRHRCAVCRRSEVDLANENAQAPVMMPSQEQSQQSATSENGDAPFLNLDSKSNEISPAKSSLQASKSSSMPAKDGARLWRCSCCPVAYCPAHLPAGAETPSSGRGQRVGEDAGPRCFMCRAPPPRVRLARVLERSWARLASNYLSLPFMRPFLNGVIPPSEPVCASLDSPLLNSISQTSAPDTGSLPSHGWPPPKPTPSGSAKAAEAANTQLLDLVGIILRIRGLAYRTAMEYLSDLDVLRRQAHEMIQGEPDPTILEALDTLLGNARRFLDASRKEVAAAEALIVEDERCTGEQRHHEHNEKAQTNGVDVSAVREALEGGKWRQELEISSNEVLPPEYCPARTLEEWSNYIAKAPMLHVETQQPLLEIDEAENQDAEKGEIARIISQLRFEDAFPHRTTLLQHDNLEAALEHQSTLLRRCLEGHATLRRSIKEEKAVIYQIPHRPGKRAARAWEEGRANRAGVAEDGGSDVEQEGAGPGKATVQSQAFGSREDDVDDSNIVTMGDMHILKELQLANQNLRARLDSKNTLLRQREMQIRAVKRAFLDKEEENLRLQTELERVQGRAGNRGS